VLLAPNGCEVSFKARTGEPLIGHSLCFDPAQLSCAVPIGTKFLLQNASKEAHGPTLLLKGNTLVPLLDALADDLRLPMVRSPNPDGFIHVCPCPFVTRLQPVIEELIRVIASGHGGSCDIGHRVMAVLGSLQEEELQALTIDELARRCGYSRRHLGRLVREQCGTSLSKLVIRVRLEKAADMLRDPARKIFDVATDCGFNHLGVFSRRFREQFGVTPAVWRRQKNDNRSVLLQFFGGTSMSGNREVREATNPKPRSVLRCENA
jgi:AraC-like DNA-binding protein